MTHRVKAAQLSQGPCEHGGLPAPTRAPCRPWRDAVLTEPVWLAPGSKGVLCRQVGRDCWREEALSELVLQRPRGLEARWGGASFPSRCFLRLR